MSRQPRELARLREEILRLGPWHLDVEVTPKLSTSAFLEATSGDGGDTGQRPAVSFISPRHDFLEMIRAIYPEGLEGRSFLDCACNCGGYSFWMKEIGAGSCFGFDVREHWIAQARFLLEHREGPTDGITFEQLDLYGLGAQDLDPFEITLFKGILYHLPDPVAGLKLAADLTGEVLILDTQVRIDLDDGMLVLEQEETANPMSGVYGLNWIPTGPRVLEGVLEWMGFPETRITQWIAKPGDPSGRQGRIQIVAARDPGRLSQLATVSEVTRMPSTTAAARDAGQADPPQR